MLIHALSLKGVGDQVAWVDFKEKEEICVAGLFCKKTHIYGIMQLKLKNKLNKKKELPWLDANIIIFFLQKYYSDLSFKYDKI